MQRPIELNDDTTPETEWVDMHLARQLLGCSTLSPLVPLPEAIDQIGRILPVVNPVQGNHRGSTDGFVATINPLIGQTTFLSISAAAASTSLPTSPLTRKATAGSWVSRRQPIPVTRSGLQPELRGRMDGFVVKISL